MTLNSESKERRRKKNMTLISYFSPHKMRVCFRIFVSVA